MNASFFFSRTLPLAMGAFLPLAGPGDCQAQPQLPPPLPPQTAQQAPVPPPQSRLGDADLRELLGPIALYPDALVALILPAATVPSDVVLGARYVEREGDPAKAGAMPWDDSVKALVRYPDVLTWMSENLEWTSSLGEAFLVQPADVMNTIQRLRESARAAGNLRDTPQQRVVVERETIRIVPAEPEIIYVPQYNPQVVYSERSSLEPLITFGSGLIAGAWLTWDFDWNRREVYRGKWRGWQDRAHSDGNVVNPNFVNNSVTYIDWQEAQPWQPSQRSVRQISERRARDAGNARYRQDRPRERSQNGADRRTEIFALPTPEPIRVRSVGKDERQLRREARETERAARETGSPAAPEPRREPQADTRIQTDQPIPPAEHKQRERRENHAGETPPPSDDIPDNAGTTPAASGAEREDSNPPPTVPPPAPVPQQPDPAELRRQGVESSHEAPGEKRKPNAPTGAPPVQTPTARPANEDPRPPGNSPPEDATPRKNRPSSPAPGVPADRPEERPARAPERAPEEPAEPNRKNRPDAVERKQPKERKDAPQPQAPQPAAEPAPKKLNQPAQAERPAEPPREPDQPNPEKRAPKSPDAGTTNGGGQGNGKKKDKD